MTLGENTVKDRDARLHIPAAIVRSQTIQQLQQYVQWVLEHRTGFAITGNGYSTQYIWPNVVAVDVSVFD